MAPSRPQTGGRRLRAPASSLPGGGGPVSACRPRRLSPPKSSSARGCGCSAPPPVRVKSGVSVDVGGVAERFTSPSLLLPDAGGREELIRGAAAPPCSPQALQAALQLLNIQMLAFTPPHTRPRRVYLYTHTQRAHAGRTLVLGELLWPGETEKEGEAEPEGEVRVTLRQQPPDGDALKGFFSILTTVLQTVSSQG